jgi:CubicO group peptidase (beta-lactamase class C family)
MNTTIYTKTTLTTALNLEIDLFLKNSNFQGSILIAKDGNILFKKGYGLSNHEHNIHNTTDTIFRIGSITKLFTAIAIMQLQEAGKLNVNDPISKYLPSYPLHGERITIHHLLSHTSGIPSLTELPNIQEIQRHPSLPQQTLNHFQNLPLHFRPGTDCEYSDSGYIVLGAIIEAITKKSYAEYLQDQIFHPLKMNSTYFDYNHLVILHHATGYTKNEKGELSHPPYIDMSFPHASGALASTVEDLYLLDRGLKNGTLLKKESIAAIFAIQGINRNRRIAYGYGLRIGPENKGMEECEGSIVGHFGSIEGYEAAFIRYLNSDLSIILLSNVEQTPVRSLHKSLAEIIDSRWRLRHSISIKKI